MKLSEQQASFAQDVAKLLQHIHEDGEYLVTLGECFRTPEQALIYAKSGKGIKDSLHCKRLAIDLNLIRRTDLVYESDSMVYKKFGIYWETLDPLNRWGGRFFDGNHFQRREME